MTDDLVRRRAALQEAIERDRARRWWARCAFCTWGAMPYDVVQSSGHDPNCPWVEMLRSASMPDEVDLDGVIDGKVRFVGKARRVRGNTYRVLADVEGCLCVVEVTIGVDLARQP